MSQIGGCGLYTITGLIRYPGLWSVIFRKRGSPLAPLDTICSIEEFYG